MDLISKKELLEITGISYGQLYRWKRERLIPEEWFIKQSSFTGQETFFPREQILVRIKSIMEMKDTYSLEEVADFLSSQDDVLLTHKDVDGLEGVAQNVLSLLVQILNSENFTLRQFALVNEICRYADCAGLPRSAFLPVITDVLNLLETLKVSDVQCTLFQSGGAYHICFSRCTDPVVFDRGVTICCVIVLGEKINYLKSQLGVKGQEKR